MFGTGRGTLRVVQDGSEALGEVRDGSCYPLAFPGRVIHPAKAPGRVGGPLGDLRDRSGMSGTG